MEVWAGWLRKDVDGVIVSLLGVAVNLWEEEAVGHSPYGQSKAGEHQGGQEEDHNAVHLAVEACQNPTKSVKTLIGAKTAKKEN